MEHNRSFFWQHAVAAGAALLYAWLIFQAQLMATALQFVTPVLVMMAVHLAWLSMRRGLVPGFSMTVYRRTVGTAVFVLVGVALANVLMPKPASAQASDALGALLGIGFCVIVIAVIAAIGAGIIWFIARLVRAGIRAVRGDDPDDPTRLNDVASLAWAVTILTVASLEGVTDSTTFATHQTSARTVQIAAPPERVWVAMQTATSPDFPLPNVLASFPQPTAVEVDEGTGLGAMRVVRFEGREGVGHLTLQVTERTETSATFSVLSDTSPYSMWIAYDTLTYTVRPSETGTALTLTLTHDRLLSPAWFFGPAMKAAGTAAMGVLARDVKSRAEAL